MSLCVSPLCSYHPRPESFPPRPDRAASISPTDQGRRVPQCEVLGEILVVVWSRELAKTCSMSIHFTRIFASSTDTATGHQDRGMSNSYRYRVSRTYTLNVPSTLFLMIDKDPPPILAAGHLSFSAGQCLQPGVNTAAATLVTKTTRAAILRFRDF